MQDQDSIPPQSTGPRPARTALPLDLRDWFGESDLLKLTLQATEGLDFAAAVMPPNADNLRPQMMVTLLCYCYAVGICGSQDIEWAARLEGSANYLCAGDYPDTTAIQYFRRYNVHLLRKSLTNLFFQACLAKGKTVSERVATEHFGGVASASDATAADRLDLAMLLDSDANDD